jgi:hypothetical protein
MRFVSLREFRVDHEKAQRGAAMKPYEVKWEVSGLYYMKGVCFIISYSAGADRQASRCVQATI